MYARNLALNHVATLTYSSHLRLSQAGSRGFVRKRKTPPTFWRSSDSEDSDSGLANMDSDGDDGNDSDEESLPRKKTNATTGARGRSRAVRDAVSYEEKSETESEASDYEESALKKKAPAKKAATKKTAIKQKVGKIESESEASDSEDDSDGYFSTDKVDVTICAGDVIQYYAPTMVAGDPRALRRTTVIRVRPEDEYPLRLENSELIPEWTRVKKTHYTAEDVSGLVECDAKKSRFISLELLKLQESGSGTIADGVLDDAAQFSAAFNRQKESMRANSNGFAPMDAVSTLHGGKHMDVTKLIGGQPAAAGGGGNNKSSGTGKHLLFIHVIYQYLLITSSIKITLRSHCWRYCWYCFKCYKLELKFELKCPASIKQSGDKGLVVKQKSPRQ